MMAVRRKRAVALFIGLLTECVPVPGLLAAALAFPQGVHSDHAMAYMVVALASNFVIVAGIVYGILALLERHR